MRGSRKLAFRIVLALAGAPILAHGQVAPTTSPTTDPLEPPPQTPPLFDYAFSLGIGHTDNVDRTSVNPTSQNILQPSLNFTFNQQGSKVQAQAVGLVQYTDYLQGFYGNEFRGQFSGVLNWTIAPQRLNFDVEDYSSVQPVNTRLPNAPTNQQQVNAFIAGPTLSFRFADALRGEADLRYINTTASKTKDYESQRGLGALRVIRDLSPTAALSGNIEAVHVDFGHVDPTLNAGRYDKYSAYLRYASRLQKVDFDLSVGGNQVNFGQGLGSYSGPLVRASLAWRVTPRNTLQLNGSDQLADSTANLSQAPNLANAVLTNPILQIGRAVISPAVFRDRSVSLAYFYRAPRLMLTLSPYYSRLRQLNGVDLSRNGYGFAASATYLIRPLLTLGLDAGIQTTQYTLDDSHDRDRAYGINLSRQLTPHWSWNVAFIHDQRGSSVPGNGYTENRVFGFLSYRR